MLKKLVQKYKFKKNIKQLAHLISSEGMLLAQQIVEGLPLNANDDELLKFCDRVEKKYVTNKESCLFIEFATCIKISFEWSCFQLNCFDRTFQENKWDGAFEILFDEVLKIYIDAFRDIYEFEDSSDPKANLKKMLHNKMNLNNAIYGKNEWNVAADLCNKAIEKLNNDLIKNNINIKIDQRNESERVFEHFMNSISNEKICNVLMSMKN